MKIIFIYRIDFVFFFIDHFANMNIILSPLKNLITFFYLHIQIRLLVCNIVILTLFSEEYKNYFEHGEDEDYFF